MDENQPVPERDESSFENEGPARPGVGRYPVGGWGDDQDTGGVPGAFGNPMPNAGTEAERGTPPGIEVTEESGLIPPQAGERKAA